MLHKCPLHKWIFCFTTVKFFFCYWILLYSGSISSTSLLRNFARCFDIKYEFKKKLLKKVNTARYEWNRFWCFKVYYFSAPAIYHSHINWKSDVKNYKSNSCAKRRSARLCRYSWKWFRLSNEQCMLQKLHSWIRSEIRLIQWSNASMCWWKL